MFNKNKPKFSVSEIVLLHDIIYAKVDEHRQKSAAQSLMGNTACAEFHLDKSNELENLMLKLDDVIDTDLIDQAEFSKLDGKTLKQRLCRFGRLFSLKN